MASYVCSCLLTLVFAWLLNAAFFSLSKLCYLPQRPHSHVLYKYILRGFSTLLDLVVECFPAHGMEHLIIPTRDYLYAPSFDDINRAVGFIHHNASCGRATYVHCKAGRGRSTTVALCYMVKYKQVTPSTAMDVIRAKRPRVLLTSMQAKAVQQYYSTCFPDSGHSPSSDEVLITQADLEGYKETSDDTSRNKDVFIPKAVTTSLSSILSSLTIACSCVSIRTQQPKRTAC